jgi:hypothetical protein
LAVVNNPLIGLKNNFHSNPKEGTNISTMRQTTERNFNIKAKEASLTLTMKENPTTNNIKPFIQFTTAKRDCCLSILIIMRG